MGVTMDDIRSLREQTGAGIMDCKRALQEADGSMDEAVTILRKKGLASAAKKAGRAANEGVISSYIHHNNKVGVLIEVNCETDFVARTDEFQALVKDLCMHIAAASPTYVTTEEVCEEEIAKEREIFRSQALEEGKPEKIIDKIVDGKINKYYEQIVLLEQAFVKDQDKKVKDVITDTIAKLGENMQVARFSRFQLGETQENG